jgi:hypothetical protein
MISMYAIIQKIFEIDVLIEKYKFLIIYNIYIICYDIKFNPPPLRGVV